jgi:hypothetical protein
VSAELIRRIKARLVECGDCLLWPGACADNTSPAVRMKGKTYSVRRVLWEAKNGPVPAGKLLGVTCECPTCVKHVAPQTHSEIAHRRVARGGLTGDVHGRKVARGRRAISRWKDEDIAELRTTTEDITKVAARLGMNHSYACSIARGDQRKDFSNPFAGLGA